MSLSSSTLVRMSIQLGLLLLLFIMTASCKVVPRSGFAPVSTLEGRLPLEKRENACEDIWCGDNPYRCPANCKAGCVHTWCKYRFARESESESQDHSSSDEGGTSTAVSRPPSPDLTADARRHQNNSHLGGGGNGRPRWNEETRVHQYTDGELFRDVRQGQLSLPSTPSSSVQRPATPHRAPASPNLRAALTSDEYDELYALMNYYGKR